MTSSSSSLTSSSVSSFSSFLDRLPRDILVHLIISKLDINSLCVLGRSNQTLLTLTHQVDLPLIPGQTDPRWTISRIICTRWEGDAFLAALLTTSVNTCWKFFRRVDHESQPEQKRNWTKPYSWRHLQIGRVTHCHVSHYIGTEMFKLISPHMYLLTTIRSLTISANIAVSRLTVYPPHLTRLTFGQYFVGPIGEMKFPKGLQELVFSEETWWNDSTFERLVMPSSLRVLRLCGEKFRQSIEHVVLPSGLVELEISGRNFNRSVAHLKLPEGLTRLTCTSFARSTFAKMHLPSTLTELMLGPTSHPSMREWIPPSSLKRFSTNSHCPLRGDSIDLPFSSYVFELPDNWSTFLKSPSEINFRDYLTRVSMIEDEVDLSIVHFPPSVTFIHLVFYQGHLAKWNPPPALRELIIGQWNDLNLTNKNIRLPDSLTQLRFDCPFTNRVSDFVWPPALECLSFYSFDGTVHLPRIPPMPLTMKRIEMKKATNEWLRMPLPSGCYIYDMQNVRDGYCRVSEERILAVRFANLAHAS